MTITVLFIEVTSCVPYAVSNTSFDVLQSRQDECTSWSLNSARASHFVQHSSCRRNAATCSSVIPCVRKRCFLVYAIMWLEVFSKRGIRNIIPLLNCRIIIYQIKYLTWNIFDAPDLKTGLTVYVKYFGTSCTATSCMPHYLHRIISVLKAFNGPWQNAISADHVWL